LVAPVTMTRLPVKLPSRLGVQGDVTALRLTGKPSPLIASRVSSVKIV
jgi:hypothetical protein